MSSEAIEDKQLFLRSEILEAGIDPDTFLEFLVSTNPSKRDDLEQWSLEELAAVVEVFKGNMTPIIREEEVVIEDSPTKNIKQTDMIDDSLYIDTVPCEKKIASSIGKE